MNVTKTAKNIVHTRRAPLGVLDRQIFPKDISGHKSVWKWKRVGVYGQLVSLDLVRIQVQFTRRDSVQSRRVARQFIFNATDLVDLAW